MLYRCPKMPAQKNEPAVASTPQSVLSLETLIEYSERRAHDLTRHSFFSLLEEKVMSNGAKREQFLACIQCISRHFQTILLTRQAFCHDVKFATVFASHLLDEINHDKLIAARPNAREMEDSFLEAVLCWFSYQMVALDNPDKAALVHLVLEEAGDHFHRLASGVLSAFVTSGYFETHAELDKDHARLGADLLSGMDAGTYSRLHRTVAKGWDMMTLLADRILALVEQA